MLGKRVAVGLQRWGAGPQGWMRMFCSSKKRLAVLRCTPSLLISFSVVGGLGIGMDRGGPVGGEVKNGPKIHRAPMTCEAPSKALSSTHI